MSIFSIERVIFIFMLCATIQFFCVGSLGSLVPFRLLAFLNLAVFLLASSVPCMKMSLAAIDPAFSLDRHNAGPERSEIALLISFNNNLQALIAYTNWKQCAYNIARCVYVDKCITCRECERL